MMMMINMMIDHDLVLPNENDIVIGCDCQRIVQRIAKESPEDQFHHQPTKPYDQGRP